MNVRSFSNYGKIMSEANLNRGEHTRTEIIRAAHDLFVKQGYHGTSMRQIANQANVALGGLYNHFEGKEDVFQAVFLEYHPYHEVVPALLAAKGETVEQFVRNGVIRILEAMDDRPDFLNLMFIEIVEFNSVHTYELARELTPVQLQIVERVREINLDKLRPIPPLMLVRTFLGLFFAYKLTEIIFAQPALPEISENDLDYFIDIYLHGILKSNDKLQMDVGRNRK